MPLSPLEWAALVNAVLGAATPVYFLVKGKWREMFLSVSLLVFAAYWYWWHAVWLFNGHPNCPVLLNVILVLATVVNLPPPPRGNAYRY